MFGDALLIFCTDSVPDAHCRAYERFGEFICAIQTMFLTKGVSVSNYSAGGLPDNDALLLAIDEGTTSTRAVLYDIEGRQMEIAQSALQLTYPHDGWVEQCAVSLRDQTLAMCRQVLEASDATGNYAPRVAAIGITNQRETTIIWDGKTGEPIYNAIVWQDRRTAKQCATLKAQGHEASVQQKTGLLLDPYFCATKIAWVLDNIDGARQRAEAGELKFGTVDSYLLWHLTGGVEHATDATNASRTLLFDIHRQQWDDELLALFNIPVNMLPVVKDTVANFGRSKLEALGVEAPVTAMVGDQQSALVGQACFNVGDVKSTYGTGCFLLMNTGDVALDSKQRLLTTVAYRLEGKTTYATEGAIFVAGAAIQWLCDGLNLIADAAESEALAKTVDDSGGVCFVPALTGLGAPYWNPQARGLISGITRDTQRAHIVRAALEAQAYQTRDLVDAIKSDGGVLPQRLRVDGGLVENQLVCQMLADQLQVDVEVPQNSEATVWGAACLAGMGIGLFDDFNHLASLWRCRSVYRPSISANQAQEKYQHWQRAVQQVLVGTR